MQFKEFHIFHTTNFMEMQKKKEVAKISQLEDSKLL